MHRQAPHTGSPFSRGRLRLMQSKKPKSTHTHTHKLRGPLHLPQVACRHGKQFFKIEDAARRPAALTRRGSRRLCTSLVFLHFFTAQTYRAAGGRRQQERLGRCGLALGGVRFEKEPRTTARTESRTSSHAVEARSSFASCTRSANDIACKRRQIQQQQASLCRA